VAWFGRSQHDKTKQTIFLNDWNGWNDIDSLSCMSHEWSCTARGKMIFSCNEKKNIYDIEGFLKTWCSWLEVLVLSQRERKRLTCCKVPPAKQVLEETVLQNVNTCLKFLVLLGVLYCV
jgi:hypothetical protein